MAKRCNKSLRNRDVNELELRLIGGGDGFDEVDECGDVADEADECDVVRMRVSMGLYAQGY